MSNSEKPVWGGVFYLPSSIDEQGKFQYTYRPRLHTKITSSACFGPFNPRWFEVSEHASRHGSTLMKRLFLDKIRLTFGSEEGNYAYDLARLLHGLKIWVNASLLVANNTEAGIDDKSTNNITTAALFRAAELAEEITTNYPTRDVRLFGTPADPESVTVLKAFGIPLSDFSLHREQEIMLEAEPTLAGRLFHLPIAAESK